MARCNKHKLQLQQHGFRQSMMYIHVQMSLGLIQTSVAITIYSLDSAFALSKPIHRNPPHITSLRISVTLFETGIKVINLLTPWLLV